MADHKLEPIHKDKIVQMLAMRMTSASIQKELLEEYGIKISLPNVAYYQKSKKWSSKIEAERERMRENFMVQPFISKQERVMLRGMIVQRMFKEFLKEKKDRPVRRNLEMEINRLLDSIKDELEPLEINMTIDPRKETERLYETYEDRELLALALKEVQKYLPPGVVLTPDMEVEADGEKNGEK